MIIGYSCCLMVSACQPTRQPPYVQTAVLRGSDYDRGFQHGQQFAGRIRSLYTTLLTHSLMPYLNRERPDVASVLLRYQSAEEGGADSYFQKWQDDCIETCTLNCRELCGFSYLLMRDSALNLKRFIPQQYLDEMQGIADGSDLPFEKILILNTFFDTLLAFRSITYYIRQAGAPMLKGVRFPTALTDGRDNNGDGRTDEDDEGILVPFEPGPFATLVEVPPDGPILLHLNDIKLGIGTDKGDEPGVDPNTVRIRYNDIQYEYPRDMGVITILPVEGDPESLDVEFLPPGGFREAAVESLVIQAGDFNRIVNPPPMRARFMRDERIVFSTRGYGQSRDTIPNRGQTDGQTQPPSMAFAATGLATADGYPMLAHHFALLDSNTTHKHTVLFVHVPDDGIPHAVLGYSGLVWGLSGMNATGLAWTFTTSDTLDNPMVAAFTRDLFDARLVTEGVPIGILGRDLLGRLETVDEAVDVLEQVRATFGWNVLVADADGGMAAVELDSNLEDNPEGGAYTIRPGDAGGDTDPAPVPLGGTGSDDLYIGSHYLKNLNDLTTRVLIFDIKPQRFWSSFYYRSVRARSILGAGIRELYGRLDADSAIALLRTPDLVDTRDSMIAAVFLPRTREIRYAMGQIPATDGEFLYLSLDQALEPEAVE
jgi:hypothetical protein